MKLQAKAASFWYFGGKKTPNIGPENLQFAWPGQ